MACRRKIAFELGKSANMKHLASLGAGEGTGTGAEAGAGAGAVALVPSLQPAVCGNQTMPLG